MIVLFKFIEEEKDMPRNEDDKRLSIADRICRTSFQQEGDVGYAVVRALERCAPVNRAETLTSVLLAYHTVSQDKRHARLSKRMSDRTWRQNRDREETLTNDLLCILRGGYVPISLVGHYILFRLRQLKRNAKIVVLGQLLELVAPYTALPDEWLELHIKEETSAALLKAIHQVSALMEREGVPLSCLFYAARIIMRPLDCHDSAVIMGIIHDTLLARSSAQTMPEADFEEDLPEDGDASDSDAETSESGSSWYTPQEWRAIRDMLSASNPFPAN